jgi:hypothetical protein
VALTPATSPVEGALEREDDPYLRTCVHCWSALPPWVPTLTGDSMWGTETQSQSSSRAAEFDPPPGEADAYAIRRLVCG